MQSGTGIIHTAADEIGDGTGVVHQTDGVLEHIGVDPLQDVLAAGIGFDLEGGVDVSVAEGHAADRLAIEAESVNSMFHKVDRSPLVKIVKCPRLTPGGHNFIFYTSHFITGKAGMQAAIPFLPQNRNFPQGTGVVDGTCAQ